MKQDNSDIYILDKVKIDKPSLYKRYGKRILSLFFSVLALPFLIISFIIVAPIIKLTDHGDIIYKDKRLGMDGKAFTMYKYRSMCMNAGVIRQADGVSTIKDRNDSRVTPVGRFIRKYGIDELPQVINVIKGDMSFIGPRPDFTDTIDRIRGVIPNPLADITPEDFYEKYYQYRLSVRPGITGYVSAFVPHDKSRVVKDMAEAWYAVNMSFALDTRVFFGTIAHLLTGKHR